MDRKTRIAVVGAGPRRPDGAGFRSRGFRATVYEQAPTFADRRGIISRKATKVLRRSGSSRIWSRPGSSGVLHQPAWDTGATMCEIWFDAARTSAAPISMSIAATCTPWVESGGAGSILRPSPGRADKPVMRSPRVRERLRSRPISSSAPMESDPRSATFCSVRSRRGLPARSPTGRSFQRSGCADSRFPIAPNGGAATGTSSLIS